MYYAEWEYHPAYGCYSRLIFKETKDGFVLIGRKYKLLNSVERG